MRGMKLTRVLVHVSLLTLFFLNHPSLPTPSYSVFVFISVFMALSTVFHAMHSPDNSPLSHSVLVSALLVLSTRYISL